MEGGRASNSSLLNAFGQLLGLYQVTRKGTIYNLLRLTLKVFLNIYYPLLRETVYS
jgi:hypothetical protein